MLKRSCFLLISLFCLLNTGFAQSKGVLLLTGILFFNEGISAKSIDARVDGATLAGNRIPLNKEFEIHLLSPAGFTEDNTKTVFAAVEMNIVSLKGVLLGKVPNVFKENEAKGFPAAAFKDAVVKIILKPELLKTEPGCIIKLRYYDLKGKNQLRLEFPVTISKPGEALQASKTISEIKAGAGAQARSVGLKIKNIDISIDTTIRVSPKMAYASLDISNIEGTSISEVLSGKESYWVYDTDLNEIKSGEKQLKQVGGAIENNVVNYLSKIPFRLKTATGRSYIVRFRWESTDRRKVIDVVFVK